MADATSSRTSIRKNNGSSLDFPKDILELLNKTVGWDSREDMVRAKTMYTSMKHGQNYPNFSIGKELESLKDLLFALRREYDICKEECENFQMIHQNFSQSLADELVELVPNIKDMPGYEFLTTWTEKYYIEQALQKKGQEVKPQVEDLAIHLEDFRKKLRPMDQKDQDLNVRLGSICIIHTQVNFFIQTLVAITKQSRLNNVVVSEVGVGDLKEDKDNFGRYDLKRKKLESATKEIQKLVDRKEVEEGLLKLLKEVGGKTLESNAVDMEFRKKWDSIVDDFSNLCG